MHRLVIVSALVLSAGCGTYRRTVEPAERSLANARAELTRERLRLDRLLAAEAIDPVFAEPAAPPGPPPPATRAVLLVLDVEDSALVLSEPERVHLSSYLGMLAVEQRAYRVTPRGVLTQRLREEKLASLAPCVDDACRLELGKALAAERVLYPRLLREGSGCVLGMSLYGLRSETAEWGRLESAECTLPALYRAAERAAAALPSGAAPRAARGAL